jgi:hypothetical protein
MISGYVHCPRVLGGPEAHECSRDIVKLEFGLNSSRLDQRNTFVGPAHRACMDVLKEPLHFQRIEKVLGIPQAIELR